MDAQFQFFGSRRIRDDKRPIIAGLNYFLTHEARGGHGKKLLGEKRDVKVWLAWLERRAHREVEALDSPIGYLPRYEDLERLFAEIIDKPYPRELYEKQFALYIDNILARLDLQRTAYGKEKDIPPRLFKILDGQRIALQQLKTQFGAVVSPAQLDT